jgi:hypothetical protein
MLGRLRTYARTLRLGAQAAVRGEAMLRQLLEMAWRQSVADLPRLQDPKRLLAGGFKVYSQGHEDGMIAEVFRRIGVTSKRFLEFGVQDGLECNSAFLLVEGWSGVWIEGSAASAELARNAFRGYPVHVVNEYVTVANADALIASLAGEEELDLLSIDIDSNDYWVWQAITTVRPRLVVIEYNATFPPFVRKTIAQDETIRGWNGSNYYGASLGALTALGASKGYSLVGCTLTGVNAFFVRDDLLGEHFCPPYTAQNHYEPPRYGLIGPAGHMAGMGPWVDV